MYPKDTEKWKQFTTNGLIIIYGDNEVVISISDEDLKNGSPKLGDMIARNPKNHSDQWLVAEQYFKDNFEQVSEGGK